METDLESSEYNEKVKIIEDKLIALLQNIPGVIGPRSNSYEPTRDFRVAFSHESCDQGNYWLRYDPDTSTLTVYALSPQHPLPKRVIEQITQRFRHAKKEDRRPSQNEYVWSGVTEESLSTPSRPILRSFITHALEAIGIRFPRPF